jgi:threonine dehydrogenase-like Zn-dependent dehydrogenase
MGAGDKTERIAPLSSGQPTLQTPATMEAVVVTARGEASLVEVPMPRLEPGWALIKIAASGICATDLAIFKGDYPWPYPIIPGHEGSGIVVAVGDNADDQWLAKAVVGENGVGCLRCDACRSGRWRFCRVYQQIGFGSYGGAYAEYLAAPVYGLREPAPAISFEQGALMEPMAVAFGVLDRAAIRVGDTLTDGLVWATGPEIRRRG